MYISKNKASVKGRRKRRNGGGLLADLMLCFPTRPHLKLLPKPVSVSSPSRPNSDQRSQLPLVRAVRPSQTLFRIQKRKALNVGVLPSSTSEPTSPKVSCVGQIKVRSSRTSGVGLGEENKMVIKRPNWFEALGLKNEIVHLFHAIRGLRLKNMGCIGKFRGSVVDYYTTDDDEEEEEDEETRDGSLDDSCIPPPNALLLMRCRSAPANGLLRREEKVEEEDGLACLKLSSQVVKETVVAGSADPLMMRCRSLKR